MQTHRAADIAEYQERFQTSPASAARVLPFKSRSRRRRRLSESELLLSDLLEGSLADNDYGRVMPFHGIDARYKKCPSFLQCFYPLGYGGFAPGPTVGAFGDAVATLCYLTGKGGSIAHGLPIAVLIGEHDDCECSRTETKAEEREVIDARNSERTSSQMLKLLSRPDIEPALRSGRMSVVLTKSFFVREGDGKYSLLYQVLPGRTNQLLETAGRPKLSEEFSRQFGGRVLVFGKRAERI